MKVKDLIKKLQNLKKGMNDKEVFVRSPNNSLFKPNLKFKTINSNFLDRRVENIECIVLDWD